MANVQLRKNPETGETFFWEDGAADWQKVEARRNPDTGETFVLPQGGAEWRNLGVYSPVTSPAASPAPVPRPVAPAPIGDIAAAMSGAPTPTEAPAAPAPMPVQAAPAVPAMAPASSVDPVSALLSAMAPPPGPADPGGAATSRPGQPAVPQDLADMIAAGGYAPPVEAPMPPAQGAEQPSPFAGMGPGKIAAELGRQAVAGAVEVPAGVIESMAVAARALELGLPDAQAQKIAAQRDLVAGLAAEIQKPDLPPEIRDHIWRNIEAQKRALDDLLIGQGKIDAIAGDLAVPADQRPMFKAGDALRKGAADLVGTPDPRMAATLPGQLAQGLGNVVGFGVSAALGGLAGGAAAGAGLNAAQVYKEARAAGLSEEEATAAAKWGGLVGTTEILPLQRAFNVLPRGLRAKAGAAIGKRIGQVLESSGEEAAQEAMGGVLNNLIAQGYYDPERGTWADVPEQAIVGAILGGGVNVAGQMADAATAPKAEAPKAAPESVATQPAPQPAAAPAPMAPADVRAPVAAPAKPGAAEPQAAPDDEVMDEVETINGETVPTGRRVRVDLKTGRATVIDEQQSPSTLGSGGGEAGSGAPEIGPGAPPAQGTPEGAPAGPSATNRGPGQADIEVSVLGNQDVAAIGAEPEKFQYKGGGDAQGVTDRLQGVKAWDPVRAGMSIVYEYADGRRVIADGHQRLGLAKRLAAEGQRVQQPALIIRETDGYSPEEVRSLAALKNIAEGSGTAIDAAKILRADPKGIDALNLPPKSALVRDASGMARLSPDAFGMVVNEAASERDGAIVGRVVQDQAVQANILALLTKLKPANAFQAEQITQQAAAETATETQTSLFGDEQVATSLYAERAKVLDATLAHLKKNAALFRTLVENDKAISAAGNTLDTESNRGMLDQDRRIQEYLLRLANSKGPISDALSEAARSVKSGTSPGQARSVFLRDLRRILAEDGAAGRDGGETGADVQPGGRDAGEGQAQAVDAAPEPQTERTPEGVQALIPGVKPITDRQRAEAAMAKPKTGRDSGPGSGRDDLFGNPEDRRDLFDAEPAKAAPQAKDTTNDQAAKPSGDAGSVEGVPAGDAARGAGDRGSEGAGGVPERSGTGDGADRQADGVASEVAPKAKAKKKRAPSKAEPAREQRPGAARVVRQTGATGMAPDLAPGVMRDLRAALDRMGLSRVSLGMDRSGRMRQGAMVHHGPGLIDILIGHALDPAKTLYHESIHAMRALNMFTPQEWFALEQAAVKSWVEKHKIPELYPDLLPSEQIEEAIAEEFAEHAAKGTEPRANVIGRAYRKAMRFLKAIRDTLTGRELTAEAVFDRAMWGELQGRDASNTGERQRMESEEAGRSPGGPVRSRGLQLPKDGSPDSRGADNMADADSVGKEQRLPTDTPAFKRWFGDSKVVDESGKPLVVYHGAGEKFDAFRGEAEGLDGIYFSSDRDTAAEYANERADRGAPTVVEAYLSLKNPLVVDYREHLASLYDEGQEIDEDDAMGFFAAEVVEDLLMKAKEGGRDGVILRGIRDGWRGDGGLSDTFVAFRPEQIKSTDNRGTFDPDNPGIREQRMPAQQRAHAATAMSYPAHIPDRRIFDELRRSGATMWQRIGGAGAAAGDAIDKARVQLQDRFLPVLRAQQAVMKETGKPLPIEQDAYIAETTFSGKVGRHLFEIDEDFTKPIADLIGETKGGLTVDSVGEWLTARHAKERNAYIASINPDMPDGGAGMTTAEADRILASAAAGPHADALAEIGALIDRLRNRTIDLRRDAGLLTPAEAAIWKNQYRHYVPLKGFAETDHSEAVLDVTGVGRRFNTRGPESKKALGRKSEAFNPLMAAIVQAQEVAIRAEKNRVGNALYQLVKENPAPAMWEVKTPQQKRVFNRTTGLVETRVDPAVSLFMDPNEMAVKVDGVEQRILFNDPRLARAAGSVGADRMNALVSLLSKFGRYFSTMNTMLSPEFMITNAFRDMQAAQVNIQGFGQEDKAAIAKSMIRNWPRAWAAVFRGQRSTDPKGEWGKWFKEYQKAGAQVSFWNMDQPEAQKLMLERMIADKHGSFMRRKLKYLRFSTDTNPVLGGIERVNMAVDNAIRLAAFVEARKRGWPEAKAAALAKNLTVNFNRRGEAGPTLNAAYVFFNAAMQGTQIMAHALTHKRVLMTVAGIMAMAFLNDLANASFSDEDDDGELLYDKIPDYKQQMNMVSVWAPVGEDKALTIPMPYGYNVFWYGGTQMGKVVRGVKEPGDALAGMFSAMIKAFSPISGEGFQATLSPTILDPINEMVVNEDWLGRPIRPESPFNDFGPDAYKFYGGATDWAKFVADKANRATGGDEGRSGWLDVSPEYIDHTFNFLTGGVGRFLSNSLDTTAKLMTGRADEIEAYRIPFYRKLITDMGESRIDVDRYYRFKGEVQEANEAAKTYAEVGKPVPLEVKRNAALAKAMRATDKELKRIRDDRKKLDEANLDPARQREMRKRLAERERAVALAFNRQYLAANGPQGE